jgi:hypothetical protein
MPAAVTWKAAQINADTKTKTQTKPKPMPKDEPSTSNETSTDTASESHIGAKTGNDISADTDTDQTRGDSPSTKPKAAGQQRPSTDDRLEHGRQTPNPQERRGCATPQ